MIVLVKICDLKFSFSATETDLNVFDVTFFLSHTYKTYVTTPKLLRKNKIEKTNKLAFIEWTPLLLQ